MTVTTRSKRHAPRPFYVLFRTTDAMTGIWSARRFKRVERALLMISQMEFDGYQIHEYTKSMQPNSAMFDRCFGKDRQRSFYSSHEMYEVVVEGMWRELSLNNGVIYVLEEHPEDFIGRNGLLLQTARARGMSEDHIIYMKV